MSGLQVLLMAVSPPFRDRRRRNEPRAPDEERRINQQGSNGMNGHLPLWLQAVRAVGVVGVIAFFLVYVGANEVPRIKDMIAVLIKNDALHEQSIQDLKRKADENNQMLRRICSVVARDKGGSDVECWK